MTSADKQKQGKLVLWTDVGIEPNSTQSQSLAQTPQDSVANSQAYIPCSGTQGEEHTREEMRVKRTSCIATAQQVQFIYYYGTNNYKYLSNATCAINNLITQYGVISASIGFYPILSETKNRTLDDEYFCHVLWASNQSHDARVLAK